MVFKSAEPILGCKYSQENGTCATAFPLYDTSSQNLQSSELLSSFDEAPPKSLYVNDCGCSYGCMTLEADEEFSSTSDILRFPLPFPVDGAAYCLFHPPALMLDPPPVPGVAYE